jgi:predicted ATPase
VQAEQRFPVAPLVEAEAVRLFESRARARDPEFAITEDTLPAIAEICRRLGGLPLAIELAAARIGVLDPQGLAARLTDALDLLGPGPADAPERQRTLRATLDWNHDLLDGSERRPSPRWGRSPAARPWP